MKSLNLTELLDSLDINDVKKTVILNWFEQHKKELCEYLDDQKPDFSLIHRHKGETEEAFLKDVSKEHKTIDWCIKMIKNGVPKDYVLVCDRIN